MNDRKQTAPYPDIAGLAVLMRLYALVKHLSEPDAIGETKYIENLALRLSEDGIIGNRSLNQAYKLAGKPYYETFEKAEGQGIRVSVLDKIAKEVLQIIYSKVEFAKIKTYSHWGFFLDKVVGPTAELKSFNERRYFKYLSVDERKKVELFVSRKIAALNVDRDIHVYIVYVWSHQLKNVTPALLRINKRTKDCFFEYYAKVDEQWVPHVSFVKDNENGEFALNENLGFITFVEANRGYRHLGLYLQTSEIDFYRLPIHKGFLMISTGAGVMPTAMEIIVQKYASFKEAFNIIEAGNIDSKICFELINRRFEANISSTNYLRGVLRSEQTFEVLQLVKGAYLFSYFATSQSERQGSYILGVAYLEGNGILKSQVTHSPILFSYVDNENYLGSNAIQINPLVKNNDEQLRLYYNLKIEYNYDVEHQPAVTCLKGKSLGLRGSSVLGGHIVFLKVNDKFGNFEKFRQTIAPKQIKADEVISAKFSKEEKTVINLLIEQITKEQLLFPKLNKSK